MTWKKWPILLMSKESKRNNCMNYGESACKVGKDSSKIKAKKRIPNCQQLNKCPPQAKSKYIPTKITVKTIFHPRIVPQIHRKTNLRQRFQSYLRVIIIKFHVEKQSQIDELHDQEKNAHQPTKSIPQLIAPILFTTFNYSHHIATYSALDMFFCMFIDGIES